MDIILNKNEYYTGLVNFILVLRMFALHTSKLQTSIVDKFATETLTYGDQKAFAFIAMLEVEDYNETSSLLTRKDTRYGEEFIGEPIKKKIALSRMEAYLNMAMMSSGGMSTFVSQLLGLMESTKNDWLYNDIIPDLLNWEPSVTTTGKEMTLTVPLLDPAAQTLPSEINAADLYNQKKIALAYQKTFDDFALFTDIFLDIDNGTNANKFKSALEKKDLMFIGNAKYMNEQVVNLMAPLLRSNVIDENFTMPETIKIPERTFVDNGHVDVIGFVCHKYWYQWFYHFVFMGSFLDPDTYRIKNVLHFWYSKGRLKHLPAVKIVAATATPGA